MSGLVDAATIARIAAEPDRPLHWRAGSDPAVGAVVADRFGAQVVTRSVDPMLSGVYAGSAATIGIRSAVPAVAAALDAGAQSLTAAVQRVLSGSTGGPVFGAVEGGYRVLLDALLARSRARWVDAQILGIAREGRAGRCGTEPARCPEPTPWYWLFRPPRRRAAQRGRSRAGAAAARVPVASAAVLAMAVTPGTPFPPQSGVLVAGESVCTRRRSPCPAASGAGAAVPNCCGSRSAGSATISLARPRTSG